MIELLQKVHAIGKEISYDNATVLDGLGYIANLTTEFLSWQSGAADLLKNNLGVESEEYQMFLKGAVTTLIGYSQNEFHYSQSTMLAALELAIARNTEQNLSLLRTDDIEPQPVVNINTGGGAYIAGNVNTNGDFVGRDKITK